MLAIVRYAYQRHNSCGICYMEMGKRDYIFICGWKELHGGGNNSSASEADYSSTHKVVERRRKQGLTTEAHNIFLLF